MLRDEESNVIRNLLPCLITLPAKSWPKLTPYIICSRNSAFTHQAVGCLKIFRSGFPFYEAAVPQGLNLRPYSA
jgi:hypothetical protein